MKRSVILLGFVFLLWVGTGIVGAQEAEISEEHLVAAHELLRAMLVDKTLGESIEKMVDVQIQQNPSIAPFRKVMLEFFSKYMSWESLKDDMAEIYAEEFSIQELKELTAFYRTPTGRKAALLLPQLMSKGAELGMRRVQEHMPELQQMIAKEAEKIKLQ